MPPEEHTPDILLRLQTALSMRRHEGIRKALFWYKENPEELAKRTEEFDRVMEGLRKRLTDKSIDSENYQHAAELKNLLQDRELASLKELANLGQKKQPSFSEATGILSSINEAFHQVDSLLSKEWSWAGALTPQQTASGLLIEGYGLMAENHYHLPEIRRAFVMAFEEELIINHKDSEILKDVFGWMEEEKGTFSGVVQKEIEEFSQDRQAGE